MKFGITWWGENWLKALQGVDFTNRIPRGKSYANTGKVYDIEIDGSTVTAKVRGKSYDHYNTRIKFKEFTQKERKIILETINESETLLSSLLNHQLPTKLYTTLLEKGVEVFPTSVDDIQPRCNCPDYAFVCKHIAGLVYMTTHEVDKDPFQVFKLQGLDLLESLDYKEQKDTIKSIQELTRKEDPKEVEKYELDFSKIPDLKETIFSLLNENPTFYDSDFKKILRSGYTSMERYAKKYVDGHTRNLADRYESYIRLPGKKYPNKRFNEKRDGEIDEWTEKQFIEYWDKPNQWENFKINLDSSHQIKKITTGHKSIFDKDHSEKILFALMVELNESHIEKYNYNIQYMNTLTKFTTELIKNHAILPEIFKNKDTYYIRWIPALFDKEIAKIVDKLTQTCPDDLIRINNRKLSRKDQIISAVSILIKGFLSLYLKYGTPQITRKHYDTTVYQLFFCKGQKFDKFEEKGNAELIKQWLSKFTLNKRDYDISLIINEYEDSFRVDIEVTDDENQMRNINDVITTTDDTNLKINLLRDIHIINEVLPEVNQTLTSGEEIEYNLDEFSNFFINSLPLFEIIGINIILPKGLRKIFKPKLTLNIASSQNEKGYLRFKDIVKFDWEVAIGDTTCTPDEFKELTRKSRGLVKIANEYVILDENDTKSLIKQIDKLPEKLNRHELLKASLSGQLNDAEVNIDDNIREAIENMKKYEKVGIPEELNGKLRKYQEIGYSWLVQNIKTGFGSILADDMGLGKTIQVLTTILHLKNEGLLEKEKVLIIAPTSLLSNWQKEINKFTPTLTSFIFHGSKRKFPKEDYDIYLTSYGVIRRDEEKFKKKKWYLSIVDEAQNIKNPNTQQSRAIKAVKSKHRIALSGTPVENRLSEYWSIFDFINKGYLTSLKRFRDNYIVPIEKERNTEVLDNFKMITQPFLLRRLKSDKNIIKDLPDKITNDVYCSLTRKQTALYQEVLDDTLEQLDASEGIERKGLVLNLINSLKQICNHPSQYTKSNRAQIGESGKMELLANLLENIIESNEKVLIFTQYVQMGNIIKNLIEDKFDEEVLFLHGSLSRKQRDALVDKFQNNSQSKIFLLSLKAGGTGLNLTAASNVIHYDLWWNPAVENQATDRAYRIGQDKNVMVYRFITTATFEEKINDMIHDKKELAEITVGSGEKFITEMDDKELKQILSLRKT